MKILKNSTSGKLLTDETTGKVLSVKIPFGLYQAEQWNAVSLYNHILSAFETGFSGIENPEAASDYMEGLFKLPVDLSDFNLSDTTANRELIHSTLVNVTVDNPLLCYNINMTEIGSTVYNGYTITSDGTNISGVWIYAPNDTLRATAKAQTLSAIAEAKAAVLTHTTTKYGGLTPRNTDTLQKRRDVAKILHDWIMTRGSYATTISYWSKTIYAAVIDDDNEPVCVAYAQALAYLCKLYGISCVYVEGTTDTEHPEYINHAWNLISFNLPYSWYPNNAEQWAAIDLTYDDGRHDTEGRTDWWGYFCTGKTYHHESEQPTVVTRLNSAKGYPVDVPTATYQYYGSTLYGIAEEDWTDD